MLRFLTCLVIIVCALVLCICQPAAQLWICSSNHGGRRQPSVRVGVDAGDDGNCFFVFHLQTPQYFRYSLVSLTTTGSTCSELDQCCCCLSRLCVSCSLYLLKVEFPMNIYRAKCSRFMGWFKGSLVSHPQIRRTEFY